MLIGDRGRGGMGGGGGGGGQGMPVAFDVARTSSVCPAIWRGNQTMC